MNDHYFSRRPKIRPVRLIHPPLQELETRRELFEDDGKASSRNTFRLFAISGNRRAVLPSLRVPEDGVSSERREHASSIASALAPPPSTTMTETAVSSSRWLPSLKIGLSFLAGIAMLFFLSRVINISSTFALIRSHLSTAHGILFTCLALSSFLCAFSIRGMRWRVFILRLCPIRPLQAVKIFWIAVFLNFLLPVQGGELGKCLILKQLKGVLVSRSLPTVAMDKSLDLLPALCILATVAFIPSLHMNALLWMVLGIVSGLLIGVLFTVTLMAWNPAVATLFVHRTLRVLPKALGFKLEAFALGFLQSLLEGASQPKTFLLALVLTGLAISCDGLFAWFAFQAVGISTMTIGEALFGYTTVTLFSVLPNPPGQVGSNELVDVMVFSGLLNFPKTNVLAMPVLFHPLTALLMVSMGLFSLASLGLSLKSALTMSKQG